MNDEHPQQEPHIETPSATPPAPEAAMDSTEEAAIDFPTRIAELEQQAAEFKDGWQRARAELENFRRRTQRDREQWEASYGSELLLKLLPVIDDFDLAIANVPEGIAENDWVGVITSIHRKLLAQFEALGLAEIEALELPFDPNEHEAVMQAPAEGKAPGTITSVLRKGYRLKDRVIRPALVRLAE